MLDKSNTLYLSHENSLLRMKLKIFWLAVLLSVSFMCQSQSGSIDGRVLSDGAPLEFVTVQIEGTQDGAVSDALGRFQFDNIAYGSYVLLFRSVGFIDEQETVVVDASHQSVEIDVELSPSQFVLEQMVVTGTKTFKRQTDSPVIVSVLDIKTLEGVQACNLSDALNFQTGLRVETDCQTCNYTQLRMNGLAGGYSQILINGRPLFSPLTGLYGMEQIPVNMIERIETVRGGGSSLYGSSAIGGTVNVITKIPKTNGYDVSYTFQNINGQTNDMVLSGNANVLSESKKSGVSIFINNRNRGLYDHNGDNFSELPSLKNNSFGTNLFFMPKKNHKLEVSLGSLSEYRYGGEITDAPAHLALQSEERQSDIYMGSADYQVNFNDDNSSLITYLSAQLTDRTHYTGIFPDDSLDVLAHLEAPPYGTSKATTYQLGVQANHRLRRFVTGDNVLTLGAEFVVDDVYDDIPAYRYLIDQRTENFGVFLQSDWELSSSFNLLSGVRLDQHNLLDEVVLSPRVSLLYKYKSETQLRLTYSTGFRAPQAFDADLHIAFAGGGISRVSLSPNLDKERSSSVSGSVNFDRPTERMVYGFTAEAFYTFLDGAFYLEGIGEDEFGERFEKRNGDGATVQGVSLEARANFNRKLQIESGFTFQTSLFGTAVENVEGLSAETKFLRTPNDYGFLMVSILPENKFSANVNLVYTGEMLLAHFAGAPEQLTDEYVTSTPFAELGLKTSYTIELRESGSKIEIFGGAKNILNAYQNDFDSGKNRDSNYVYGPAAPRTLFVGLRLRS